MYARRIDDEGMHATQFRCPISLWREIVQAAEEDGRSVNSFLNIAVKQYLKEQKENTKTSQYTIVSDDDNRL